MKFIANHGESTVEAVEGSFAYVARGQFQGVELLTGSEEFVLRTDRGCIRVSTTRPLVGRGELTVTPIRESP